MVMTKQEIQNQVTRAQRMGNKLGERLWQNVLDYPDDSAIQTTMRLRQEGFKSVWIDKLLGE